MTASFVCPLCTAESFNPNDIAHRYCGRCHVFVDDELEVRALWLALRSIAEGKLVQRGDHTEVVDLDDAADVARLAMERYREKRMSEERKADMEAQLAELKFEIELAIIQKSMPNTLNWTITAQGPDGEPWIAVLTIGKVSAQ